MTQKDEVIENLEIRIRLYDHIDSYGSEIKISKLIQFQWNMAFCDFKYSFLTVLKIDKHEFLS